MLPLQRELYLAIGLLCLLAGSLSSDHIVSAVGDRELRIPFTQAAPGSKVSLPVYFNSLGNEAALLFTIEYDPTKLLNLQVELGPEVQHDVTLTKGVSREGCMTILLDSLGPWDAGMRPILNLTFNVTGNNVGETPITITQPSVADTEANLVEAKYSTGIVHIITNVEETPTIFGRVLSPEGNGLRNAKVTITSSTGATTSVYTGSMGFFKFEDVDATSSYRISTTSKRYRYGHSVVMPSLRGVDLVGFE